MSYCIYTFYLANSANMNRVRWHIDSAILRLDHDYRECWRLLSKPEFLNSVWCRDAKVRCKQWRSLDLRGLNNGWGFWARLQLLRIIRIHL